MTVLVPAHNESGSIESTCTALLAQLTAGDRLLVIADNCTDDTAERARNAGAVVLSRTDPGRRGKGYALDFGVRYLEHDPPAAVIVVDADCELERGSVERLARTCVASGRPIQAIYVMQSGRNPSLRVRIAAFAAIVKNLVRPLGFSHLQLPCMLMGTGMAFPWNIIARAELATGHIVEDMKLGVDLAVAGTPPMLCPRAHVVSHFPDTPEGFKIQRTRWEHGHISVIISETPRLLAAAISFKDWRLLAMALDLLIPPLALLTLLVSVYLVIATGVALWTGQAVALWLGAILAGMLAAGVFMSWARFGRSVVSAGELLLAPWYAFVKIPIYLRYLYRKQTNWVRSERDKE